MIKNSKDSFMKYALTFLLFLFWNFYIPQQASTIQKIDSMFVVYKKTNLAPQSTDLQSLYTELYHQSKEIDYAKGQMEALLQISIVRIRQQKDYDKIILETNEAEKIAKEIEDYNGITRAKIFRGKAYFFSGLPKYAKREFDAALKVSEQMQNEDKRILAKINIYSGYSNYYEDLFSLNKKKIYMDSCAYFLKKKYSQAVLIKKGDPNRDKLILTSLKSLSGINLTLGKQDEAEYYLNLMEKSIHQSNDKFNLATYHKLKGEFEFKNNKKNVHHLDSALYHFKKAELYANEIQNTQLLELIYPEIANVFDELKDRKSQTKYLEKTNTIKDSIRKTKKEYLQKINPQLKTKSPESDEILPEKNSNFYYIGGILLGFIITGWFLYKKKIVNKKSVKIDSIQPCSDIAETTKVIIPIEKFIELASKNDDSFLKEFQEYFPGFCEKLLQGNTTFKEQEIEFCAFIKLNFDTKKIASIKDISVRAVESKKYRIRKKLNLSGEENLYIWMSNFR